MKPPETRPTAARTWARYAGACFGAAAALLTATAALFVFGHVPIAMAVVAAGVAAMLLAAGALARRKAER